jgi:hypothetical protein
MKDAAVMRAESVPDKERLDTATDCRFYIVHLLS